MSKKLWIILPLVILLTACGVQAPPRVSIPPTVAVNPAPPSTPCPACPSCPTCPPPVIQVVTATPPPPPPVTLTPSRTPTQNVSPTPTATQVPKVYTVQPNSPAYLQNFSNPAKGCAWTGVGGQAFDKSGQPVTNLVVMIDGELNGKRVEFLALTGLVKTYGPGGFEITLGSQPFDSNNTLRITLYNTGGAMLSEPFTFSTYNSCQRNQIIINFVTRTGP